MPRRRGLRVLVVGGGPGGLQAASTAAQRGHHVTLFERSDDVGGQVAVAARVPGRAEFLDMVRNLRAECARYGVDVKTGTTATASMLRGEAPDAVVLATGAHPSRPWWAGSSERVVDVRDVLEQRSSPSGRVLVVDDLGFHQATSVAELLADRGCEVQISTSGMVVGQDLGITLDMEMFCVRAHAKGIALRTDEVITGVADGPTVQILRHTTGETSELAVDWVVCATHPEPEDELWQALRDAPFAVHRVGDCVTPRRAHAAVIEGHRVAVAL